MNYNDPLVKKFLIIIGILVILSPLGILLTWNQGAWGEWDPSQLAQHVHANVSGMLALSGVYNYAPMQDYDVPGWDDPFHASIGYILSAIVGIILCTTLYFILVKFVVSPSK